MRSILCSWVICWTDKGSHGEVTSTRKPGDNGSPRQPALWHYWIAVPSYTGPQCGLLYYMASLQHPGQQNINLYDTYTGHIFQDFRLGFTALMWRMYLSIYPSIYPSVSENCNRHITPQEIEIQPPYWYHICIWSKALTSLLICDLD